MWTWQRDFETAPAADPGSIPGTPNCIYVYNIDISIFLLMHQIQTNFACTYVHMYKVNLVMNKIK